MKLQTYVIRQTAIAGCLNLGEIICGFGISWPAPILPKLYDIKQTPLPYVITQTQASWIASLMYFGIIGSFLAGYITNLIGRRSCFILGAICNILSYILVTVANNIAMIYAARVFIGICMSFLTLNTIIYIGEVATPSIRGKILASTGVFHALGSLLVYCIGPYLSYSGVGYVIIGINVIYIICSFYIPESPVYYVIKGDDEAARESLRYLDRSKDIDVELKNMIAKVKEERSNKYIWRELFILKSNRRCLYITLPILFFQESSGVVAVLMFATTIFQNAGSSIEPAIATMIVGATMVVGTLISPALIERSGRRFLLIISTSGCCLSMAILGAYFYLDKYEHQAVVSLRWLPLVLIILALLSYTGGLNIIPNTLTGEMFGPNVRGIGTSVSLSFGYLTGFVTTTIFGYIIAAYGSHVAFWVYTVINFLAVLFVIAFVPETRGKSLMEINDMMTKNLR